MINLITLYRILIISRLFLLVILIISVVCYFAFSLHYKDRLKKAMAVIATTSAVLCVGVIFFSILSTRIHKREILEYATALSYSSQIDIVDFDPSLVHFDLSKYYGVSFSPISALLVGMKEDFELLSKQLELKVPDAPIDNDSPLGEKLDYCINNGYKFMVDHDIQKLNIYVLQLSVIPHTEYILFQDAENYTWLYIIQTSS